MAGAEHSGPGAHAHPEDDVFYVVEGTMSVLVSDRWVDAQPGSFVLIPGGTTHDFENRSRARAGVLNLSHPGVFELHMPAIADWFAEHPPGDPFERLMIVVITDHWTELERVADAEDHVDMQGRRMRSFDGFLFRFRIRVADDPLQVSTLTAWESTEALAAWTKAREEGRTEPKFGFARIVNTVYEVDGEIRPGPSDGTPAEGAER